MSSVTARKVIPRMVRRIVSHFHPEQVILFGSRARGMTGPDSDIDLLVVMSVEGGNRRMQTEIRLALSEFPVPKDIVVTTPEEFDWRKNVTGTIERPAWCEGRVLYARE
jgi:predicted nucleotidyltransferase